MYTERKEKGNDRLPILSVSIHSGISDGELSSDSLGKEVKRSEDKTLYKHTYPGDLVFNMMRAWQGAIGVVKNEGMVSPAYIVAKPNKNLFPRFMNYYFQKESVISQMNNLSYGVTDFRKRLYWDSFIIGNTAFPSTSEQKKISDFLDNLSDTIALHQRKLKQLNTLKQGYLQQLFPKNGEKYPKVRFANFEGHWEQCKLSELFVKGGSGGTPRSTNKAYYEGNIPFLGISDISKSNGYINDTEKHINDDGLNNSSAWVVPRGSLSLAMYASVGKLAILNTDLATSQAFYNMVFNDDGLRNYVFQRLEKAKIQGEWTKLISTGTQANLNAEKVKNFEIEIPQNKDERYRIGILFQQIDIIVDLTQKKIHQLEHLKKSFLQKMFN